MSKDKDIVTVQRGADTLNALIQAFAGESGDRPDLFTEPEWAALRAQADDFNNAAAILCRKAMQGRVDASAVAVLTNRSRVMALAASPLLVRRVIDLALNGGKGDEVSARTCLALLKGLGITTPSKPIDEQERQKNNIASAIVGAMSPDQVRASVKERLAAGKRRRAAARGDEA